MLPCLRVATRLRMPNRLTMYELELMDILWNMGEGTVQEVCNGHERDLAYTTVMTSLNILHSKKNVVERQKLGRAFVYRPTVSREEMSRIVLNELSPILFKKHLLPLVIDLLATTTLERDDIKALKHAIKQIEVRCSFQKQGG